MTFDLTQFLSGISITFGLTMFIVGMVLAAAWFINGWKHSALVLAIILFVLGVVLLSAGAAITPDRW